MLIEYIQYMQTFALKDTRTHDGKTVIVVLCDQFHHLRLR